MRVQKKIKIGCIFDNFYPKLGGEPMQNQMLVEKLCASEKFLPVVFPLMWEQGLDTQDFDCPIHPIRTYEKFPNEFNQVTGSILWDRVQNIFQSRSIRSHLLSVDMILTDLHSAALIGSYYKQFLGKKLVIRFGGNVFRQGESRHEIEDKYHWLKGFFFQIPAKFSFKMADKIIVNGQDLHDELIIEGFDSAKIHIIPVGLSPNIFYPPNSSREILPASPKKRLRVLFYGRITEANGPLQFIDIIKQLCKYTQQPLSVTVIGDGPLLRKMKNISESHRLPINFLARQSHENLSEQIRQHHFCVFPFRKIGGVSSVITESMACGRLVFTTNSGDMANVVKDYKNGFLSQIDHPVEIADKIIQVVKDQALQRSVSDNAVNTAHQGYAWSSVMEKYINVFSELARF